MKNLEIKLRVNDLARQEELIRRMGASPGGILNQVDTYFHVPRGRLKVRDFTDGSGELIFYDRNESGKARRWSQWQSSRLQNPEQMCVLLGTALGVLGVVKKKRVLYLFEDARIHLDHVPGLGCFIEIESTARQSENSAEITFHRLIDALNLNPEEEILCSYLDLMANSPGHLTSDAL